MGGVVVAALFIVMATMIYSQWIRAIHAEKKAADLQKELTAALQVKQVAAGEKTDRPA